METRPNAVAAGKPLPSERTVIYLAVSVFTIEFVAAKAGSEASIAATSREREANCLFI
ncbi:MULTISPECIES: hypothetical protein [Lonsdalea]|uniref:hypothetical protein n=1 Tax=Lonsdalea TaxID=1082702 RepID=UPI0013C356B7|nr:MULTISPECIES: hypothetical protein [Lonsdalea]